MDGTTAVALLGLLGVIFNTVWNWLANRKKQEQDVHIKSTAAAVKSFQEANDELREELKRIAADRDRAREEAASAAEQVLGVMADALNKNTASNNALADVIRESIAIAAASRTQMQEVTATLVLRLTEITAVQESLLADMRANADTGRVATATLQERLDQGFERLMALAVEHDENARHRLLSILEAIERLTPSKAAP